MMLCCFYIHIHKSQVKISGNQLETDAKLWSYFEFRGFFWDAACKLHVHVYLKQQSRGMAIKGRKHQQHNNQAISAGHVNPQKRGM